MEVWSGILDSCPGLLCCVVNIRGRLVYATHGYKAIAARLLGHKCEEGRNYPPLINELDRTIHEVLTAACLGKTNAIEISERGRIWDLTASPLRITSKKIEGVVIRIMRSESADVNESRNSPPVIRTNPEVLNSVPFRACIVDSNGVILSANKFLSYGFNTALTGRRITDIAEPESESDLNDAIAKRSGKADCKMYEVNAHENFYSFDDSIYHDEELNAQNSKDESKKSKDTPEFRHVRLHAGPIKWDDKDAVMLTFEDVTEYTRTHEQLRKLLTFEPSTGLLNRRGIQHVILRELGESIKTAGHLSLIMMSIDNFKAINKAKGYMSGNRVLRDFVHAMKKFLADYKNVSMGRWGGDEFMILAHCSGASGVVIADEIRSRMNDISVSAGVADLTDGGYASVNEFIAAAYDAMTDAKDKGGNLTVLVRHK